MNENEVGQWVVNEHRNLLSTVRGVEAIVEAPTAPATGDVARRLDELAQLFESHAEQEERTSLYREFPRAHPEHAATLEELQREHAVLVRELRVLTELTEHAPSLGLETPLNIRIRTALAQVRRHEAAEAAVVQALNS